MIFSKSARLFRSALLLGTSEYITFLFALSEDLKSFLGYIGDKIGFKIVLAVTLFSAGLSATAFDWTPRFNEHYRIPTLSLLETNQSQK